MKIRFSDYTTMSRDEWRIATAPIKEEVFDIPLDTKLSDIIERYKDWSEDFRFDRWYANLDGWYVDPKKVGVTLRDVYGEDPGNITARFSIDGYIDGPDPAEVLSGYTADDWRHEIAGIVRVAIDEGYYPDGLYEGNNQEAFEKAFKEVFMEEF